MRSPVEPRESLEMYLDEAITAGVWQRFTADAVQAMSDYWLRMADGYDDTAIELLATAFRAWQSRGTGPRERRLDPPDDPRWPALAQILAIRARRDPDVVAFRDDVLDGQPIPVDDVDGWIRTTADADGPATRFVTHPVDDPDTIVQHRTELLTCATGYDVSYPKIKPIRLGGMLWRLRTVARRLATGFGWPEAWTALFVLTDIPPPRPMIFGYTTHEGSWMPAMGWLDLRVNPWGVDPRDLERTYRTLRQDLIPGSRVDAVTDRSAALAVFWEDTDGMATGDRRGLWNRIVGTEHPDWVYPDAGGNFGRDARLAHRNVTGEGR